MNFVDSVEPVVSEFAGPFTVNSAEPIRLPLPVRPATRYGSITVQFRVTIPAWDAGMPDGLHRLFLLRASRSGATNNVPALLYLRGTRRNRSIFETDWRHVESDRKGGHKIRPSDGKLLVTLQITPSYVEVRVETTDGSDTLLYSKLITDTPHFEDPRDIITDSTPWLLEFGGPDRLHHAHVALPEWVFDRVRVEFNTMDGTVVTDPTDPPPDSEPAEPGTPDAPDTPSDPPAEFPPAHTRAEIVASFLRWWDSATCTRARRLFLARAVEVYRKVMSL